MKYPALTYVAIYVASAIAFLLAPNVVTLMFIAPAVYIAETILSPEVWRTAQEEGIHRADRVR